MTKITCLKCLFFLVTCFVCLPNSGKSETSVRGEREIDAQLQSMRNMLPVEIQSGIRWVDIKRMGKQIQYTYIVNVNSADWNDNERISMMSSLQNYGCEQLMPAMCQGSQVIFASGYTAVTTYHDSFGNYLFDCTFSPESCALTDNQ